ncbi:hypothetical protein FisN_9Hu356 [Fistulifera solaris]|uniref:Uncharacterized protein n=1 Tax=Fistulifera solaris TaxID=1519565 RepID=A0A1Z5KCT0_FISSO|nr:hypothetical protein FisN_9Hu356 [Fistulifera solaris]|eukprot:GAX24104.1 hypothetical protein FisN_9Hu356 [Fistulifera solaris]
MKKVASNSSLRHENWRPPRRYAAMILLATMIEQIFLVWHRVMMQFEESLVHQIKMVHLTSGASTSYSSLSSVNK